MRAGKITEADLARARDAQRTLHSRRKLGELLVESGSLTSKELERQVRFQVEEVVFELMSWREGFFSFEEQEVSDASAEAHIRISTESLLMEAARRIDEWSRIEGKVAHLGVVPVLAPVADDHPGFLDLRPREWEVLAEIDGSRDLRAIATLLAQSEFDVARVAYGLLSTGIVELRNGVHPPEAPADVATPSSPTTIAPLEAARVGAAIGRAAGRARDLRAHHGGHAGIARGTSAPRARAQTPRPAARRRRAPWRAGSRPIRSTPSFTRRTATARSRRAISSRRWRRGNDRCG